MRESIWLKEFDPGADYEVARPFRFGSGDFYPGERFDAETSERQLRILYENRFIRMIEIPPVEDLPVEGGEETESASVPSEVDSVMAEVIEEPRTLELVTKPGGWYDVIDSDGKPVNEKSLRKDDAEKLIEASRRSEE